MKALAFDALGTQLLASTEGDTATVWDLLTARAKTFRESGKPGGLGLATMASTYGSAAGASGSRRQLPEPHDIFARRSADRGGQRGLFTYSGLESWQPARHNKLLVLAATIGKKAIYGT